MIHFDIGGKPSIQFSLPPLRVAPGGSFLFYVSSSEINTIVVLDRAEYAALAVKDAKTLYLIRG